MIQVIHLRYAFALLFLLPHAAPSKAPVAADSTHSMQFAIERAGVPVPAYTINLQQEDGHGWYAPTIEISGSGRIPITATPATLAKVFAPKDNLTNCETHVKHIANTGKKTLTYQDGTQTAKCTFNYSDNEAINTTASTFQSIAETIQAGTRLEHSHRFDRLGLDAEIDSLITELKGGQALEVANIAPTLQSIAQDERVMDRVRRKAARLLQDAGVDSK